MRFARLTIRIGNICRYIIHAKYKDNDEAESRLNKIIDKWKQDSTNIKALSKCLKNLRDDGFKLMYFDSDEVIG